MLPWTIAVLIMQPGVGGDSISGVWHNSTCVGSGYSELYAFFPDGSFRWRESQMDGVATVRERWGHWSFEGCSLVLFVDSALVWQGGKLVPAECSIGTDSMLVGFDEVVLKHVPPDTVQAGVSDLRLDLMDDNPDLPADVWGVDLDGARFWRICSPGPDMEWIFSH